MSHRDDPCPNCGAAGSYRIPVDGVDYCPKCRPPTALEVERDALKARGDELEIYLKQAKTAAKVATQSMDRAHEGIDAAKARVKDLEEEITFLRNSRDQVEKERAAAFNKGMNEGLVKAAEAACEGCREGWPVELIGDEEMHRLPEDRVDPTPPHSAGTHSACEGWWRYGHV